VDHWVKQLSGVEFKIATYLYRALEQAGGKGLHQSARELAEATGVSERGIVSARKTLAGHGIIRLEVNQQGAWYGFPEPAAEAGPCSAEIAEPTILETEPGEAAVPLCTTQDIRSAIFAEPGIQTPAPAILAAASVVPASPASDVPGPATQAPAAAIIAVLQKLQRRVLQAVQNYALAPERSVAGPPDSRSVAAEPAIVAGSPFPAITDPATIAPAARTPSAIPAAGGAITAEPEPLARHSGELVSGSPPVGPSTPANIKDQLTAAVQLLFDGLQPGAADVQRLQDCDPDQPRLLACLQCMRAHGEAFVSFDLFFNRFCFLYRHWGESPFLDDERRAQTRGR
jgi:hypothetical protein